jgi:hypothetical protein
MRWWSGSRPDQVTVQLSIPFVGQISGVWAPADAERRAAWELYVELVTRVAVVDLGPREGLLRDALSSLYSLFGTTRDILRRHGPEVAPRRATGEISFGVLAVVVLNGALRPLLAHWHPALASWEAGRPAGADPVAHERSWPEAERLREELAATRRVLTDLADLLAEVAGAARLVDITLT